MEKLPRRQPAAQQNIVGMVFDALADMMEGIPIIGDILGFVSSLFGNSRATNARVLRIEQTLSQGSKGFDDFNRGNSESSLGKHSSMTSNWVQGGDGEVLGIRDRAANVKQFITPAAGRRWAKFPSPASQNKQAASVVCAERNNANNACTSLMICADTGFTEFVYANVFGAGGIRLGRGTRSGNSWTFTQWASSNYRIGTAETLELQSDGAGTYKVIVEGDVVLSWVDTSSFPIDAAHRFCGFAIQTWTGILAVPQYGWGVEAFSIRSEADTYTAIETVETVANEAVTTAGQAATTAGQAATKADSVTGIATDAKTTADQAQAAADAVLGIAENADAKATLAQQQVQDALAGAQQTQFTWMAASGGVVLGRNEVNIADAVIHPPSRTYHCTSVTYGLESNPGGLTVQLLKISPTRVATVVRTTTIAAGVVERIDDGFDVVIERGYRFACNVTAVSGVASVLLCTPAGALV